MYLLYTLKKKKVTKAAGAGTKRTKLEHLGTNMHPIGINKEKRCTF